MMKISSGEWIAAEAENKTLRDSKRAEFWSESGVTATSNPKDIDIPPAERGEIARALAQATLSSREKDENLADITRIGADLVAAFGVGSFSHSVESLALDITELTPKALRAAYFITPELTTVELSEIGQD